MGCRKGKHILGVYGLRVAKCELFLLFALATPDFSAGYGKLNTVDPSYCSQEKGGGIVSM